MGINETSFFYELPSVLKLIFLSRSTSLDEVTEQIATRPECLLDTLDEALYEYCVRKSSEMERRRSTSSVFSFFSRDNSTVKDANHSRDLLELQLNWTETMDRLD